MMHVVVDVADWQLYQLMTQLKVASVMCFYSVMETHRRKAKSKYVCFLDTDLSAFLDDLMCVLT